jgi:hypothetical protein
METPREGRGAFLFILDGLPSLLDRREIHARMSNFMTVLLRRDPA